MPVPMQTVVEAAFEGTVRCAGVPFPVHFWYFDAIAGRSRQPNATSSRFRAQNGWRVAAGGWRQGGGGRQVAVGRWRQAGAGPQSNEHA